MNKIRDLQPAFLVSCPPLITKLRGEVGYGVWKYITSKIDEHIYESTSPGDFPLRHAVYLRIQNYLDGLDEEA